MTKAEKVDLFKQHRGEYVTPKTPVLITAKTASYLTIAGKGAPGAEAFQSSIGALYGAAYTIKMAKKAEGHDYKVPALEAQWWVDGDRCFMEVPKSDWHWKLLIRVPALVKEIDLQNAVVALEKKKKEGPIRDVKLEHIVEGQCVQMLHTGPYDNEQVTIEQMLSFVKTKGLSFTGLHHEIYLSDPRRVAHDKLKTILRHPVTTGAAQPMG
jgi:hypothetical protein